jgi:hypothetical protein
MLVIENQPIHLIAEIKIILKIGTLAYNTQFVGE